MDKHRFGGAWTVEKLDILEKYLNAYSIALKNQKFDKLYIDAFAGNGTVECKIDDHNTLEIDGSAKLALKTNPPFSKYYFIEKKAEFALKLQQIKNEHPDKKIEIINSDCNDFLRILCAKTNWKNARGLLFLDPYGMQVEWETLELIAKTKAIDVWYLFPLSALNRLLKRDGNIDQSIHDKISRILGTNDWYEAFYQPSSQLSLFEEETIEKTVNFNSLSNYVLDRLRSIFPAVAQNAKILYNTRNSPLFLFCFAMANDEPKAVNLALRIAKHILK